MSKNSTEYKPGDILPGGSTMIAIDPAGVVLSHNDGAAQPYITWRFRRGNLRTIYNCNYFRSIAEAAADFEERAGL